MSDVDQTLMTLEYLRDAGNIERYHTANLSRRQTIGEHSYNVITLVLAIDPAASRALLIAALMHDAPELATGDIPSNVKWAHPEIEAALKPIEAEVLRRLEYPALSDEERLVLKLADLLEGAYFCVELHERGDRKAARVCRVFLDAFGTRGGWDNPRAHRLAHEVHRRLTV